MTIVSRGPADVSSTPSTFMLRQGTTVPYVSWSAAGTSGAPNGSGSIAYQPVGIVDGRRPRWPVDGGRTSGPWRKVRLPVIATRQARQPKTGTVSSVSTLTDEPLACISGYPDLP